MTFGFQSQRRSVHLGLLWLGVLLLPGAFGWGASAIAAPVQLKSSADEFDRAKRALQGVLDQKKPDPILRGIKRLTDTGDARAVRLLTYVASKHPADPIHEAVEVALSTHSSEAWVTAIGKELRDARGDAAAILVIDALGRIESPHTTGPLVTALQAVRSPVLIAAIRACRPKNARALVPALIDVLAHSERESGHVWAETRITLQTMTGEKFLPAADWKKWFSSRPADWQPRVTRNGEKNAKTAVYRPESGGSGTALPRIFGQEVASKRVVFIIDTSQSMEAVDPSRKEEGSTTGAGRTRLQRAQKELIAAIELLRPKVRFNVIAYSTEVRPWSSDELLKAKKSAKGKAIKFVGSLRPDGTTSSGAALLLAMDMPDVDTIIFLSDGSPTTYGTGKLAEIDPILEEIFVKNRDKNITIHTLGFIGAKVSFMRALANETGGTYAPIR